jgi:hypothetical protein
VVREGYAGSNPVERTVERTIPGVILAAPPEVGRGARDLPPWRNRKRSRFVRGRFPVRVREEALDGEWGNGIPQAFEALRCASESRFPSSGLRSSSG